MCVCVSASTSLPYLFPQLGQVSGVHETGDSVRQVKGLSPLTLGLVVLDEALVLTLAMRGGGVAATMARSRCMYVHT